MEVKCLNLGKFIAKAAGDSAHDQDCDCFDCQMLSNFAERLTAVVENRFGLPSLEPDAEAAIEMVASGFEESLVMDVLGRLERNEHKRWQMAPAPRVSPRAFGQGWRRPLASRHDWRGAP